MKVELLCTAEINLSILLYYYNIYYVLCYLFHPRFLHNDIFRYMTREITQIFHSCSILQQTHYPCSYSKKASKLFNFLVFLQLPSRLLKYQLRVCIAPTTNFMPVTLPLVLTKIVKVSSVE